MTHETRFITFAWKFGTPNLMVTYTLILRLHLKYIPKSILGKLYIVFKALEVKNPMLQIVHKSELKRGRYEHLKQTS